MKHTKKIAAVLIAALCAAQLAACGSRSAEAVHISTANVDAEAVNTDGALVIAEQGMFSAGGITVTSDGIFAPENQWEETGAGQTAHVDHANVFYQIPQNETGLPMVFLHGYGQSRIRRFRMFSTCFSECVG